MTNRMVLNDPALTLNPGFHKQLAEATAPGFMSRVLLANFVSTSGTFATVTDGATTAKNLSISLKASTKYHVAVKGSYTRGASTEDVQFKLVFSGITAGQPEDSGIAAYNKVGTGDQIDMSVDPATAISMSTLSGVGFGFSMDVWMNVSVAGILTMQFARLTDTDGINATLYSGTQLIVQPIINLTDRGHGT